MSILKKDDQREAIWLDIDNQVRREIVAQALADVCLDNLIIEDKRAWSGYVAVSLMQAEASHISAKHSQPKELETVK